MSKKDFEKLCVKAVSGNIDKNDEEVLKNWLAESGENMKVYENIKSIWAKSAPPDVAQILDASKEWKMLSERIASKESNTVVKDSILSKIYAVLKSVFEPIWKPALASTLIFILLVSLFMFNQETPAPRNVTVITQNKEHKTVQLSDGTTVLLNNNSILSYPEKFIGAVRKVNLSGEAFFSVTKDSRPFIIYTSNATTTVLGTQFDVWARAEKTRVIVKEGLVNLAVKREGGGVVIAKNQQSIVVKNLQPTEPAAVESAHLLGWLSNKLVFNNCPLIDVADELGRFYDAKLVLANDNLKNRTLTGSFKSNDVDSVLTMICLALDLKYEKQNGGYVIK